MQRFERLSVIIEWKDSDTLVVNGQPVDSSLYLIMATDTTGLLAQWLNSNLRLRQIVIHIKEQAFGGKFNDTDGSLPGWRYDILVENHP